MIVLAFLSSAYVWIECLGQWFAGPEINGPLPLQYLTLRIFAAIVTLCCLLSIKETKAAAIAIWLVVLSYSLVSWKINAGWVFREELRSTVFWAPLFLTIAALRREPRKEVTP
jgi:hypothetical protein